MNAQYVYALQQDVDTEDLDAYENLLREQQTVGGEVFRIPANRLPRLQEKLDKLNKKATKLNTAPILFTDTGERDEEEIQVGRVKQKREWAYIAITGRTPMLNGWAFMATVEHTDHGNVLHMVPEYARHGIKPTDFTRFRSTGKVCEHCNINRYRKDTYLVQNVDTGEVKQVGSACLTDFTGYHGSPAGLARWFEDLNNWRKYVGGGWSGDPLPVETYDLWGFLATAQAVIRDQHGYVSYRKSEETGKTPTGRVAKEVYLDYSYPDIHLEDQDYETATKVIDWVRNTFKPKADNNYEQNLATIFKGSWLTERDMGVAASALTVWWRETQPKRSHNNHADGYVGAVGSPHTFVVECEYVGDWFESHSGFMKRKVQFKDASNHKIVWWTTSDTEFEVGKRYTFKAKIYKHNEAKFGKETVIGNARKVEETQAALV